VLGKDAGGCGEGVPGGEVRWSVSFFWFGGCVLRELAGIGADLGRFACDGASSARALRSWFVQVETISFLTNS
jgi:hypothetical protein